MSAKRCQVAIIGAGPSGLAVAAELGRLGIGGVVVLEREATAGGIPRHCGHSPFGFREFHRLLSGPAYARRLARAALERGADLRLQASVTEIGAGGRLLLSTPDGAVELVADKVVLGTGNRETPRSARLVSGSRPLGVLTTGALQSMVYLQRRLPFRRPVIVGSELVSFSALLTCRHAGIRPVAMIESQDRVVAWKFSALLPRLLGCNLLLATRLDEIRGQERVNAVKITDASGMQQTIDCDGVLFSGNFVPESALLKPSHLELDSRSGGPLVDQFGRCSDPDYFACGNLLHPVDTAGWCWAEGQRTARMVKAGLDRRLPDNAEAAEIETTSDAIRYFTPQRIVQARAVTGFEHPGIQIRLAQACRGKLTLRDGDRIITSREIHARPERRVLLPLPRGATFASDALRLDIQTQAER